MQSCSKHQTCNNNYSLDYVQDERGKLIAKCESFCSKEELLNDKLECLYKYFEEEIEIRIESLKIQIDKLSIKFHKKINRMENKLKKTHCESSMIEKWEKLCNSLVEFKSVPYQIILLENIRHVNKYIATCASIHKAIEIGHINDLEYYLYNRKKQMNLGKVLLEEACEHGQKDIVKIILWEYPYINKNDALVISSRLGFIEIVKHLVYKNANINEKTEHGETALLEATRKGHKEIVQFLLENNARIDGESLFKLAPNSEIFEMLVKYKYQEVNTEDDFNGQTPFYIASARGYTDIVKSFLVNNHVDVNGKDVNGQTALMKASKHGRTDTVELLIEHNANVNIEEDTIRRTALIFASLHGYSDTVKALIDGKADVNKKDKSGSTALIEASKYGHADIVKALIDHNADVNNTEDYSGRNALMFASINGHVDVLMVLIDNNADLNIKDQNGQTALILASRYARIESVKTLLAKNANANETDDNGQSALDVVEISIRHKAYWKEPICVFNDIQRILIRNRVNEEQTAPMDNIKRQKTM